MNFGSTKTKLDHILEQGFKRIDEAVEGVCDSYDLIEIEKPDPILSNVAAKGALRSGANNELLAMAARQSAELTQHQGLQYMGIHGIGDQSAHGSPLNQLGAAYHNAFGV